MEELLRGQAKDDALQDRRVESEPDTGDDFQKALGALEEHAAVEPAAKRVSTIDELAAACGGRDRHGRSPREMSPAAPAAGYQVCERSSPVVRGPSSQRGWCGGRN